MDLQSMVGENEEILWRGKPYKKCFILECVFNPLLPFALIWAIIDLFILSQTPGDIMIIAFMTIHMAPVWIYLVGVIGAFLRYKHTEYIITDRGVYTSDGIISMHYHNKPFAEMSHVDIHRGIFDQFLKVGDVVLSTGLSPAYYGSINASSGGISGYGTIQIQDVHEYEEVYSLCKKLQTDVYSDTMYPNDLRPSENHGYNTKYAGKR